MFFWFASNKRQNGWTDLPYIQCKCTKFLRLFKKNFSNKLSIFQERNDSFNESYTPNKYTPAIYTHCYDVSGTRLFAAGGPLQNSHKVRQAGCTPSGLAFKSVMKKTSR